MATRKQRRWVMSPKQEESQLYVLEVSLIEDLYKIKFVKPKKNAISRIIEMRGDQTLDALHEIIYAAYDRYDEHCYEFQFSDRAFDPAGQRFVMREVADDPYADVEPAGITDEVTLDSLDLKVGQRFGYWFDFGDDWWHVIEVKAIHEHAPPGDFPRITERKGESPPQYPLDDEDKDDADADDE